MSDSLTTTDELDPSTGFSSSEPSVAKAANDLRSAAGEKARKLAHDSADQAKAIAGRAKESAEHIRDFAVEKSKAFKEAAGEKATRLRTAADEKWHQTSDKAKELHVTAEDYIRQNPTKCVLGALGVGFLIGLVTRR